MMPHPVSNEEVAALAAAIRAEGFPVTPGDFKTDTAGAAFCLGRAAKTLRNWRTEQCGPVWIVVRGRAWYPLRPLIAWRDQSLMRCPDTS